MAPRRKSKGTRSKLAVWYDKLAAFEVGSLFSRKREPGPPRRIYVNQDLPADYLDPKGRVKKEHIYATNQVVSSKYTIITFLPRNLLEQFRRIANIFFLAIAILQFFSKFSTISPGLVILPLLVILALTAAKDGYEDLKRHQSDRHVNQSQVRVLSGGGWVNPNITARKERTFFGDIIPTSRKTLKIGKGSKPTANSVTPDIELAEQGVPPEGTRQTSTSKIPQDDDIEYDHDDHVDRRASTQSASRHGILHHNRDPTTPHWKKTLWEDVRVGDFVKIMNNEPFPADILICATSEEENVCFIETKNLDGETNLKSRNAVSALTHLRNAVACADKSNATFHVDCDRPDSNLYRLNAAVVRPDKTDPVDLQTVLLRGTVLRNTRWVIGIVMFTGEDTKIIQNAGGTPSKRSKVERQMNPQVFVNLIILAIMSVVCAIADSVDEHRYEPKQAPWLYDDDRSDDNPSINGLATWAFALITFQNIIPISLYISIEVVRTCQALFIYFDKSIWYEKTDQPTLARSWNLADDLGQIQYIFSDKTGTLTQNAMVFRHCSIGGKVYKGDEVIPEQEKVPSKVIVELPSQESSGSEYSRSKSNQNSIDGNSVPDPLQAEGVKLSGGVLEHFHDEKLAQDLKIAVQAEQDSDGAEHARALNGFWNVLALCHTVLASVDKETNQIEYKAQSPDEAALVQAAADVGFVFHGRDRDILRIRTPFSDDIEQYELMNVLDFTSARKRMSVILRKVDDEDNRIFVFTKGADSVIFERLKEGADVELKNTTEKHLDHFASEGLRTLTLAYKVIPEDFYNQWSERYHQATVALDDRDEKIEAVSDEVEHELRLLGATAIEDRLQDGVPETIADLKRAGIKVWVATGDKLETAIAIGYSTNLIGQESNLIVIRGGDTEKGGLSVYEQMYTAAERFFPDSDILNEDDVQNEKSRLDQMNHDLSLHRINTGMSSIVGHNNGERPGGFVLVIDGAALGFALADETNKTLLLRLAMECEGVICCRTSPLQKALIVKLVKDGIGAMTLAIGDGANDVSMIQAADVGVGISGEEGLQAVNSSDYAIAQFRFLKRLLLVHGHWSYSRNGNMIVNFFYKNIICIGVLWWFQIYCGWSSQYVFEYVYLLFWNVFWTLCPVIAIGLFDRIIDDDILMAIPELYHYGREGYWYNTRKFAIYLFDAVYQSAIIYFFINYAYFSESTRTDGYTGYIYEFSTCMVIAAVMVANAYNGLNTSAWTWWVVFALSIGVILIWAFTAIYSIISPGWFVVDVYGNDHFLFQSAIFWLCLPLAFCLALAPHYIWKAYQITWRPTDVDIMRIIRKQNPKLDFTRDPRIIAALPPATRATILREHEEEGVPVEYPNVFRHSIDMRGSRTDMSTGIRSIHRGFDFATEEHGVAMQRIQSNLSEKRGLGGRFSLRRGGKDKRRQRSNLSDGHGPSRFFSLSRSLRKKPPPL